MYIEKMYILQTLIWGSFIVLGTLNTGQAANLIYINGSFNVSTPIENPEPLFKYIDNTKNISIYTFGFKGEVNGPETDAMTNFFITQISETIFILLDWEEEAQGGTLGIDYPEAIAASKQIASKLGNAIVQFIKNGFTKATHLIGLSLGAHLMGWAGQTVQDLIKQNVSSIVGLEPAGLGFYFPLGVKGLNRWQATSVVGVHTNAGKYGIDASVGDIDFWANRGDCFAVQEQPGCPDGIYPPFSREDLCDHVRSVYLFISSYNKSFPAAFAKSCSDWETQDNSKAVINYFGTNIDYGKTGNFYFRTSGSPPYNLGLAGINPN